MQKLALAVTQPLPAISDMAVVTATTEVPRLVSQACLNQNVPRQDSPAAASQENVHAVYAVALVFPVDWRQKRRAKPRLAAITLMLMLSSLIASVI